PNVNASAPQTFTITVAAAGQNLPPVNTAPASVTTLEDTTLFFTGANALSVSDADAAALPVVATLSVPANSGLLNVTASGGASVIGNGTLSVQITGPVAAVNATLASLTYV